MTKGVHRVPAGSKRGRQMVSRGRAQFPGFLLDDPRAEEQRAWNDQVEAKRRAKEAKHG
uniref:Uncharacterized protein n=1 Tax=viral metagenome TaxID=1070528 RepID=A0A6M3KGD7_9ZZZZ